VPFFKKTINQQYRTPDGNTPQIIEVVIEDGTRILSPTGI